MAFTRDHGQCCVCLPLKLGVGLICMFIFSCGCFSTVSMFKSSLASGADHTISVDLQSGGYNPSFCRLSTVVGIFGIFLGFIGFLGTYDDKPNWIRLFFHYLQIRLVCEVVVFVADMYTLHSCDGYASETQDAPNQALFDLSHRNMCHWGRIAYGLGFAIQVVVDIYMLFNVYKYVSQLELNPPYPIDFGFEKYDTKSRWKFYDVAEPEEIPMYNKQGSYETIDEDPFKNEYGPDGVKAEPSFAPDGMRGPAYIRAYN